MSRDRGQQRCGEGGIDNEEMGSAGRLRCQSVESRRFQVAAKHKSLQGGGKSDTHAGIVTEVEIRFFSHYSRSAADASRLLTRLNDSPASMTITASAPI